MSTLTVWSPANGSTNANSSYNTNFSIARETAESSASNAQTIAGMLQSAGGYYYIRQSPKIFPTDSSVLVGAEITAVVLYLDGVSDASVIDFTVEARLGSAWTTDYDLTTDEWVAGSALGGKTLLATFASSGYSAGWNIFTSTEDFVSNITISGNTYIILCSKDQTDNNNTVPVAGNNSWIIFASSDGNEVTDPKLVITYTPAPPKQHHLQCHF